MHMADALISPAVGGSFWALSCGLIGISARKTQRHLEDYAIPMMGVLGAFVFAAQMINYTIPSTGSSGHIGGGLLLAILLGPWAGFLVLASVLSVQAFFFMDGGLLALGCNIFNLGFFPCFVAYPLVFLPASGTHPSPARLTFAAVLATVVGLQLGALGVIVQTLASGISSLSFSVFASIMLPVHLAIGLVEGVITSTIVTLLAQARPEAIALGREHKPTPQTAWIIAKVFLPIAAVIAIALSWFASTHPDGLEWSLARLGIDTEAEAAPSDLNQALNRTQESMALFPDYRLPPPPDAAGAGPTTESWPNVEAGTSLAGLVGGMITLITVGLCAILLNLVKRRRHRACGSQPVHPL